MLCEDQIMSVDDSIVEKGAGSLNSSGSSISMDAKLVRNSWAQEVIRAELGHSDEGSISLNSSTGSNTAQRDITHSVCVKKELVEVSKRDMEPVIERAISFEFFDGANEEKYDRLVKEEKLKTPFKRRHSQTPPSNDNSRSNSPNSSTSSTNGEASTRQKAAFISYKEEKRMRHNSYTSSTSSSSSCTESDPATLARRQKQIDYGKNTAAYERYSELVPRNSRSREHPRTPNKFGKYSRRAFDGLVKIWRKQLHVYDLPAQTAAARRGEDDGSSESDSD